MIQPVILKMTHLFEGVLQGLRSFPCIKSWEQTSGSHVRIFWDNGDESLHDIEAMIEAETMKVMKKKRNDDDDGDHEADDDDGGDAIAVAAMQGAIKAQMLKEKEKEKEKEMSEKEENPEWKQDLEDILNM